MTNKRKEEGKNFSLKYKILRKFISFFNKKWQNIFAIFYFSRQQNKGLLNSSEKEFYQLSKWVNQGDIVLDIGANIGKYTFKLSSLVGLKGHVYSFEPLPRAFFILSCLNYLGNFKNISLINCAVGEFFSQVNFEEDWIEPEVEKKDGNMLKIPYIFHTNTQSKIVDDNSLNKNSNILERRCLAIDEFSIKEKVNFIKIDVEGKELSVLKGAKNLILRDKPTILLELSKHNSEKDICDYLNNIGYLSKKEFSDSRNILFFKK